MFVVGAAIGVNIMPPHDFDFHSAWHYKEQAVRWFDFQDFNYATWSVQNFNSSVQLSPRCEIPTD